MKKNNIIQFPKLKETLMEKGMNALQNQDFSEALNHFDQLLTIEPKHPQANLGKAVCLLEQNRLHDAADICEFMLDEQFSNTQEAIQVYVSILIQLEEYKTAVNVLETALQEKGLPNIVINHYEQMLLFCREMLKEKNESINENELKNLARLLHSKSFEKQMLAVKKLTDQPNQMMLHILNQYLQDDATDPVIKSIIIQHLIKEKIDSTLEVQKFSKRMLMNPAHMQTTTNDVRMEEIRNILSDVIESKNPTLYELSIQLLSNVALTLFPFPLPACSSKVIAAVIHSESEKINGFPLSIEEISTIYEVNKDEVEACLAELNSIINFSNKI